MNNLENAVAQAVEYRLCERGNRYRALSGRTPEPRLTEEEQWHADFMAWLNKPLQESQREAEARAAEEQARAEAEYLALNGADLLRHALGGVSGTVNGNGAAVDSAADLIRWALPGGIDGRMDAG